MIERLAREAGFRVQGVVTLGLKTGVQGRSFEAEIMEIAPQETLARFAAPVAEECAKVVDQARVDADYVAHPDAEWWVGEAAKRIREAFKP